jgi:hypothetical protein
MSKKYEYFVSLSLDADSWHRRDNIILDHPMTEEDLIEIERKWTKSDRVKFSGSICVVSGYQLLSVTGTFTYRVLYELFQSHQTTPVGFSMLCTLDHKITVGSIEKDMDFFIDYALKRHNPDLFCRIISFQEIPDE